MTADNDLARRIQLLEDRAEIHDLVARYAIACDLRDFDALRECFTEDGSFEAVAGKVTGRDTLVEYFKSRFTVYGPTFHVPNAVTLVIDGDSARGTVIAHSEIMTDDGLLMAGHYYHDVYERGDDGVWRFKSRTNSFLYGMPLAELATMDWREPRRRWTGAEPVDADVPEGTETWKAFRAEIDK
jgi:uncharacterized protein (TIGR02246 family)